MAKKYSCFIISPIGEVGSETRINADDLMDLIIVPSLEKYNFDVVRGDHRSEANQIDVDVIKSIQDADLCVCDISLPNINVYYELGRRDETGKPVILLKSRNSMELPIDIATRRYIEYDLDSRNGIRDAINQLRNFVEPLVEKGFEDSGRAASLSDISMILQRLERKIDRSMKKGGSLGSVNSGLVNPAVVEQDDSMTPLERFKLALMQKNIPMAEQSMQALQYSTDPITYLDKIVEQVAAMGSDIAGQIMIDNLEEFMDAANVTVDMKTDYIGCLVSYALRKNREEEIREKVEEACDILERMGDEIEPKYSIQIHNQKNRLYYGIYQQTGDEKWLNAAISALKKAITIYPASFLCYNLALCYTKQGNYEDAAEYIEKCLEMQKGSKDIDTDHIELACKIYYRLEDPRFSDCLELLSSISPGKAALLKGSLS